MKVEESIGWTQAGPQAWYSRLDGYIQKQGFKKGNAEKILYIKVDRDNILIIEVYVDDIIFGSDDDRMSYMLDILSLMSTTNVFTL